MKMNYNISIYLDTRRSKENGKYPIKLRVFTPEPRTQKLYSTFFEFTKQEFESIWETTKPRKEYKDIRIKLQAIEIKANEVAERLPYFSFEAFEKVMYSNQISAQNDVSTCYQQAIEQLKKNKQVGTASNYELSLKSLIDFHKKKTLLLNDITPQWLRNYEHYMLDDKKRSPTTVGFYLRPLRAIFNTAIEDKIISKDFYPFGKRKYTIPAPKGIKKALSKEQLKLLWDGTPATPEQEKAKAFWFFSYASNGMNFKDIAGLQYKNISDDVLSFRRAKTANTNKSQSHVKVYLNDFNKSVIEKYGNPNKKPESYIFQIIDPASGAEKKHQDLQNYIRFINQHFGKYAKNCGIQDSVSTYWARHTFATTAIRNGASMEYVSEALNHSNLSTTKIYFAGFDDEKKRQISNKLMEF